MEVGEYLTNNVSRSIVYTLLLQQPLTRDEIETSPVRAAMRALAYQGEKTAQGENDVAHLRTLLAKGTDCGILHGFKSGGKNFYFLNSDLKLTPKPITCGQDKSESVLIDVAVDRRVGEILGETALLPGMRAASSAEMPIPQIESEKRLVLWLSWLTTPIRREILSIIAQSGKVSRPELRRRLGFWADRLAIYEGVATGILSLDADRHLSFQFSAVNLASRAESPNRLRWIERPPGFMLSRSYGLLSCIEGGSKAIEECKRDRTSPMAGLRWLESHGAEIVLHKRRRAVGSNFLQLASAYGAFDIAPKFRNISSCALRAMPDRIILNDASTPFIWISEARAEILPQPLRLPTDGGRIIASKGHGVERPDHGLRLTTGVGNGCINNQIQLVERRLSNLETRHLRPIDRSDRSTPAPDKR